MIPPSVRFLLNSTSRFTIILKVGVIVSCSLNGWKRIGEWKLNIVEAVDSPSLRVDQGRRNVDPVFGRSVESSRGEEKELLNRFEQEFIMFGKLLKSTSSQRMRIDIQ